MSSSRSTSPAAGAQPWSDRSRSTIPAVPGKTVDYAYAEAVQHAVADEVARALGVNPSDAGIHIHVHARIGKPAEEILALARELLDMKRVEGHHRYVPPHRYYEWPLL